MRVFLFPGQGSQKAGMAADLRETEVGRKAFDQASEILGYDLYAVCTEGPQEKLTRTLYTQPALFVTGAILSDLMTDGGFAADAVAGHSAGEYAALYSAGVFDLETGVKIVGRRAELMDTAGERAGGAMAAIIGMEPADVEKLADDYRGNGILGVAAYNTRGQIVISGQKDCVEQAAANAKGRGARMAKVLPVSGAFHSELMREASQALAGFLDPISFAKPKVPYVSNLTGKVEEDPESIKSGLSELLLKPVRWTECMNTFGELGASEFHELGPGTVLAGLLKKFNSDWKVHPVDSLSALSTIKES